MLISFCEADGQVWVKTYDSFHDGVGPQEVFLLGVAERQGSIWQLLSNLKSVADEYKSLYHEAGLHFLEKHCMWYCSNNNNAVVRNWQWNYLWPTGYKILFQFKQLHVLWTVFFGHVHKMLQYCIGGTLSHNLKTVSVESFQMNAA